MMAASSATTAIAVLFGAILWCLAVNNFLFDFDHLSRGPDASTPS